MKRVITASRITDYIDEDRLGSWLRNPKFGDSVDWYRLRDDMMLETVEILSPVFQGTPGSTRRRYWKFVSSPKGWEAYEVDEAGQRLSNSKSFLLEEYD